MTAREELAAALPEALMPVGAQLRWPERFAEPDPLTGYGKQLIDALLPVVERIAAERAAAELRAAADAMRRFAGRDGVPSEVAHAVIVLLVAVEARADAIEAGTKAAGT